MNNRRNLPKPGIEPGSPALEADSLPFQPPGKPKKTGVGSLSPSPGDLPDPGIKPGSPAWQADSLPTELSGSYRKVLIIKKTGREKKDVKDSTKKQKIVPQK